MTGGDGFAIGLLSGVLVTTVVLVVALIHTKAVVLVDRWWLETPERWESLRRYELSADDATRTGRPT